MLATVSCRIELRCSQSVKVELGLTEWGGGDRAAFVEMVQDEVKRLHPGMIARYRLRPSEFAAWQEARR